jgi:hypothetical protein
VHLEHSTLGNHFMDWSLLIFLKILHASLVVYRVAKVLAIALGYYTIMNG